MDENARASGPMELGTPAEFTDQQAGAAAHRNGRSIRNRDAVNARIIPIRVDSAGFHIGPRAPPPSRYLQKDKLNSRFCKF